MTKKSKHPVYDDPTAFSKKFPVIRDMTGQDGYYSPLETLSTEIKYYKMGKLRISVRQPDERFGFMLTIKGTDRLPTWDEVVWIRYNLIPDSVRMAMVLPNLNNYINQEDTDHKYTFTLEQQAWSLDPHPTCPKCGKPMQPTFQDITNITVACDGCMTSMVIDALTWNEQHSNGFLGAST